MYVDLLRYHCVLYGTMMHFYILRRASTKLALYMRMRQVNQLYIIGGDGTHRGALTIAKECMQRVRFRSIPRISSYGMIARSPAIEQDKFRSDLASNLECEK